jgi:hypothetical protein
MGHNEMELLFGPEDGGDVPPKHRRTSIELYEVTNQKLVIIMLHAKLYIELPVCCKRSVKQ